MHKWCLFDTPTTYPMPPFTLRPRSAMYDISNICGTIVAIHSALHSFNRSGCFGPNKMTCRVRVNRLVTTVFTATVQHRQWARPNAYNAKQLNLGFLSLVAWLVIYRMHGAHALIVPTEFWILILCTVKIVAEDDFHASITLSSSWLDKF